MEIVAEASAKLILCGEHAVVYGEPALGIPLQKKVVVRLGPGRGEVETSIPVAVHPSAEAASPQGLVKTALGSAYDGLKVSISFEFPPMSGLGSSAALAVAVFRAHDLLRKEKSSSRFLFERAMQVEAMAHGRPSGVDPALAMARRPLVFVRGPDGPKWRSVGLQGGFLVVASAGSHGGARRSIGKVAQLRAEDVRFSKQVMSWLGVLSRRMTTSWQKGDLEAVGRCADLAHGVLDGLGLVSGEVDRRVRQLRAAGALGAKMSGAGGAGGAFFGVFEDAALAEHQAQTLSREGLFAWTERIC